MSHLAGRAIALAPPGTSEDARTALIKVVQRFFAGPFAPRIPQDRIQWFASMTFRRPETSPDTAASSWKSWLSRLNILNPENRVTSCVWAVEPQRRGTAHIHALLAGGRNMRQGHCRKCNEGLSVDAPSYRILKESWWHHYGIARFRPYDDSIGRGGATYVLKYVLSEECEDWGFLEAGKEI